MITVRLSSGFGNQLFQYFFAQYLKEKYDQEVQFDSNGFKFDDSREIEITILKSNFKIVNETRLFTNYLGVAHRIKLFLFKINLCTKYINDKDIFNKTTLDQAKNYYFDGYWQTDYYISKIKNSDFLLNTVDKMPVLIENYILEIEKSNSVALHIRRGDYFSPLYIGRYAVCNINYYLKALNYIQTNVENPVFFVFSDDLDWVRNNLELPKSTIFVKNEKINSFWYVFLMSKAKHNIISNSTFSWWGAYLNNNKNKIVVSPDRWMLDSDKTIALSEWIKISVLNE